MKNGRLVPQPGAGLDRVHVYAQLQEPRGIPSSSRSYLQDAVTRRKGKTEEVGDTARDAFVASCYVFGVAVVPVDRLAIHPRVRPKRCCTSASCLGQGMRLPARTRTSTSRDP
jgi:hypothetical protein